MKKIILSLLFVSSISFAQNGINYQGAATDANGAKLVNQNISLKTSVLQGGVDGTTSYSETHNTTTDQFGLFNVVIGLGNIIEGSFDSIQWGADSHFLKVELDANGGTNYSLISTTQMMSVPYSLYSKSTDLDTIKFLENDEDFNSKFNNDVLNDISEFDNNTRGIKYFTNPADGYITNSSSVNGNIWHTENNIYILGEYNAGTDFDNYNIDFMGQPLLEYDGSLNAYNTGIFCAKLDTNFNYIASYSEVVDETYHRLYAVDIKVDNQNNIYLLYYKQGSDYNSYDLILRKFNSYFNLISTLTIAEDFWNGGGWNSHFKNATKLDIHNDNIVVSFDFDAGNHLDVNNQSLQHTGQGLHNWVIVSINTDMSINWYNHFTNYNQSYDQSKLLVRDKIYFIEGGKTSQIYTDRSFTNLM